MLGARVGGLVGFNDGITVGMKLGSTEGSMVGQSEGLTVGSEVVGRILGVTLGNVDGQRVGSNDGIKLGDGLSEISVGAIDGAPEREGLLVDVGNEESIDGCRIGKLDSVGAEGCTGFEDIGDTVGGSDAREGVTEGTAVGAFDCGRTDGTTLG